MEKPYIPEKWKNLKLELKDDYSENKRKSRKKNSPGIIKNPVKKIKVTTQDVSTQTDHYCCIEEKKKCTIL